LDCKTVVVERHYIDRDYMEDHSVFYSKSLHGYPNYCQRLHFFRSNEKTLRTELRRLQSLDSAAPNQPQRAADALRRAHSEFAENAYLGFAVIKPLPGCPVGRTVLRPVSRNASGYKRRFDCLCDYHAHFLGVSLHIKGLAFQQQDIGVSACATTALWTALQRASQVERGNAATPAQITMRASQFALPFGRSMPSEGLSLDQMCVAVQSFGYSPMLFKLESPRVSRALLFGSINSGIAPVLILSNSHLRHAVTAAGMAVLTDKQLPTDSALAQNEAHALTGLYIHDDRYGPYLKADIVETHSSLSLRMELAGGGREEWSLTHILLPVYPKVRLSFAQLDTAGLRLTSDVQGFRSLGDPSRSGLRWSSRIIRSHRYVEQLMHEPRTRDVARTVAESVRLPRYLAVISLEANDLDRSDVLLDTTSTERNLTCLAVIPRSVSRANTIAIATWLAEKYRCPLVRS